MTLLRIRWKIPLVNQKQTKDRDKSNDLPFTKNRSFNFQLST